MSETSAQNPALPSIAFDHHSGQYDENGRSLIGRLFTWWVAELADLLNNIMGSWSGRKTFIQCTEDGYQLYVRKRGTAHAVGPLASAPRRLKRRKAVLRLTSDQVLQHNMSIPKAARDVTNALVRNEVERILPWPLSEAVIGYEVGDSGPASNTLSVNVFATNRRLMLDAYQGAKALGAHINRIEFAGEPTALAGTELISQDLEFQNRPTRFVKFFLAAMLAAALGVFLAGMWELWPVQRVFNEMDARSTALQQRLNQARSADAAIEVTLKQREWVQSQRRKSAVIVAVLNTLTQAMPDSAYLTRLDIRQGTGRLVGYASDAAGLIKYLEAVPGFSQVRFFAPTVAHPGTGKEAFSISVRIADGLTDGAQP